MKVIKRIGLAFGLLWALVPAAQAQFRLTAEGFVNAEDATRRDYVIEVAGADRATLFRRALFFAQAQFAAPDARFSELPDEAFAVSGVVRDRVVLSGLSGQAFDLAFRMRFEVRDGAVTVCEPVVETMYRWVEQSATASNAVVPASRVLLFVSRDYRGVNVTPWQGNSSNVIFTPRGDVRNEGAKASLETFFNGFVAALEAYLKTELPTPEGVAFTAGADCVGTYVGTLPAADCEGIRTRLEIRRDGRYTCAMEYLGRDATFTEQGTCAVRDGVMTLTAEEGSHLYFQVEEGRMVLLDQDRRSVTGPLAAMYVLNKE